MSEEPKIAIVVASEGRGLWRVYPEGHPKVEFVVPSEMPGGRSFAPGTRVMLRVWPGRGGQRDRPHRVGGLQCVG
jgi:hypothetical protein